MAKRESISTPDRRLRVFVSSTLGELAKERAAVARAVRVLRLTPIMFEVGARPHPPRDLYRSYLAQSDIFIGIYWQRYGWVAPGESVSGLEDEYRLANGLPLLIYVKTSEEAPEPKLEALLERIRNDDRASYKGFSDHVELEELVADDLALLLSERFGELRSTADRRREKRQKIRFTESADGTRLAYASVGDGPPLVKAANYLTHLEHDWENPVWRHWIVGLSMHRRLVRYDERGCGLSDLDVDDFTLEAWIQDLEAVVDDAGLERFPLLGLSQGGALAIAYCARHPERVTHLILYGAFAKGRPTRPDPEFQREEKLIEDVLRLGWGKDSPAFREVFTSLYMPNASAEQLHSFYELQRLSTTAENAVRFERAFHDVDVSSLLDEVSVPTLVMHAREDARVPFSAGRSLATSIKGAQFVPLDSSNHVLLEGEPAWDVFLAEMSEFLGDVG